MKKKYLIYAAMPVLALALLAAGSASAHGMFGFFGGNITPDEIASRQTAVFEQESSLLGVSVDDVKSAWAEGKTFMDLAKEKGITDEQLQQKLTDRRNMNAKTHLLALVDKGVITQTQADQRYAWMISNATNGKIIKRGMRGFHHGMMEF